MSASYATAQSLLADLMVNGHTLSNDDERVVVENAKTFAVLALAEEVEALVELLRERLPVVQAPDGVVRATDDEPCVHDWGDRVYCGTPRSSHSTAHHEWIGAPR